MSCAAMAAAHIFEKAIPWSCGGPHSRIARGAARLLAVTLCGVLVVTLPTLDELINLVGAIANTAIAAVPCAIHLRLMADPTALHRLREAAALQATTKAVADGANFETASAAGGGEASGAEASSGVGARQVRASVEAAAAAATAACTDATGVVSIACGAVVADVAEVRELGGDRATRTPVNSCALALVDVVIVLLCAAVAVTGVTEAVRKLVNA